MPQAELGRLLRPKACYPLAEAQAESFEQAAWSSSGDRFYRYERPFGTFSRSVTLPHGVTEESIKADYRDGVLEIRVAKHEDPKPKRIPLGGSQQTIEGTSSVAER